MTTHTIEAPSAINETAPDLRQRLADAMRQHGLSQAAAANRIGFSATTLNQWIGGKYPGDVAGIEAKIARFLDGGLEAAATIQRFVTPGFQATQTAQAILAMLTQAQHAPDIVVIAGVPGIGKTCTVRHYATKSPQVWHVTMDTTRRSPNGVMLEIAAVMGVTVGSAQTLRDRLGERMRGSGGLLVIDEAQHLSGPTGMQSLDLLRSLHDRYGIGLALVGNYGVFARVAAANRQDGLAQVFSRIGARKRFEAPSKADVEIMLNAWGVDGVEERRFLAQVADKMWALRGLEKTIRAAMTMASGDGQSMDLRHLKSAWASLNHFEVAN